MQAAAGPARWTFIDGFVYISTKEISMPKSDFFQTVYGSSRTPLETRDLYNEWSETYDESVNGHGYATPRRCAAALASLFGDKSMPVLDFGCGTGISGMAMAESGFTTIDGCDLSEAMLERASERKIYRNIWRVDPNSEFNLPFGQYRHIAAVGVISVGAAPIEILDDLIGALPSEGSLTFSFNDHTLKDPTFEARVAEYTDTGAARVEFKEYGEHLPGLNMNSVVYVLVKN